MPADFSSLPEKTAMLCFDTLNGSVLVGTEESQASGHSEWPTQIEQACRWSGIAIFYAQPATAAPKRQIANHHTEVHVG